MQMQIVRAALVGMLCSCGAASGEETFFYCGTYTTRLGHVEGQAKGIGIYALDTESGAIRKMGDSPPIANSSHMCFGPNKRFLYAISEVYEFQGKPDGYLTIFTVDAETKGLTELAKVSSRGKGPAYVRLDRTGKYLLLANYVEGNVVVYPIGSDGRLGEPTANVMHHGTSVNPRRQDRPHPHSIVPGPAGLFVYVPDLGIDKIVTYAFDASTGQLAARPDLDVVVRPGGGPRHFEFDPSGKYAFLVLELTSQVVAYRYQDGKLTEVGTYDTLPEDFDGTSHSAEVRVARDGQHVYVSNRGHNSISCFAVDRESGKLTRVQVESTQGEIPRNFGIDPSGRFLVAGNQNSHTMVSYRVDAESGRLAPTGVKIEAGSPVLFLFY